MLIVRGLNLDLGGTGRERMQAYASAAAAGVINHDNRSLSHDTWSYRTRASWAQWQMTWRLWTLETFITLSRLYQRWFVAVRPAKVLAQAAMVTPPAVEEGPIGRDGHPNVPMG